MPVYFTTLGDPDMHHDGIVNGVEPSAANTNPPVFYNTLFDVPNNKRTLMPYMTAQVYFPMVTKTNVLIMPLAALDFARYMQLSSDQKPTTSKGKKVKPAKVLVLRDDKPVEVEVSLGTTNRVSAEVVSGLSEDDEVITGPMDASAKSRPRVIIR